MSAVSATAETIQPVQTSPAQQSGGCPVDHAALSQRKVARPAKPAAAIERDEKGVWHIHRFDLARLVLRGTQTKQAGFGAEFADLNVLKKRPVLFAEGKVHFEQRKQTARFFTPATVSKQYKQFMETQVDGLIADLKKRGTINLADMSLTMAIQTVARVLGLNHSRFNGLGQRLDAFFSGTFERPKTLAQKLQLLWKTRALLWFFLIDVKPAITAHKRHPQDDLISYLIEQDYNDSEILTEAVTFGAAGMATTREFITMAAWHFLENPELRARYVKAEETERLAILHEILRVEPIVGHLYRRVTSEMTIEFEGQSYIIPEDALIDLDIYAANTEPAMVGESPDAVCPEREIQDELPMLMSFGDGHHRCPGAYIAIQETDCRRRQRRATQSV